MKMADIIDLAINKYLWDGFSCNAINSAQACSSCDAISKAANHDYPYNTIRHFLEPMGHPLPGYSTNYFSEIEWGEKRQYARALWLTWAAMIAREEDKSF